MAPLEVNDSYLSSDYRLNGSDVYRPFGPLVYKSRISEQTLEKLKTHAISVRGNEAEDVRKQLAGNLSEEYNLASVVDYDIVHEIKTHIAKYYSASLGIPFSGWKHGLSKYELDSLWVNFQKAFEWNPEHHHTGDLSFVIYLKVPDFEKESEHETQQGNSPTAGRLSLSFGEPLPQSNCRINITPYEGLIVVFPSWMRHSVYPFTQENEERWSIAGNAYHK